MTQAIARIQPQFSGEELDVIRRTVASKTTKDQFALFIQVCKYSGLNPFARQIYAVVRGNEMTVQTGIDGYRILAERSGKYAGQIGPEWCDESGEWKDVWLSVKPPAAARIGVIRRDFERPIWGVARFTSYEQSSSPLWRKMPEVMLAKCAESLALRKAFPAEMAGIYTAEEMAQADEPVQATVTPQPTQTTVEQTNEQGEAVESTVEPEPVHPRLVSSTRLNKLYNKGKRAGLYLNTEEFVVFCQLALGLDILTDAKTLTEAQANDVESKIVQRAQQQAS